MSHETIQREIKIKKGQINELRGNYEKLINMEQKDFNAFLRSVITFIYQKIDRVALDKVVEQVANTNRLGMEGLKVMKYDLNSLKKNIESTLVADFGALNVRAFDKIYYREYKRLSENEIIERTLDLVINIVNRKIGLTRILITKYDFIIPEEEILNWTRILNYEFEKDSVEAEDLKNIPELEKKNSFKREYDEKKMQFFFLYNIEKYEIREVKEVEDYIIRLGKSLGYKTAIIDLEMEVARLEIEDMWYNI